MRALCQLSRLIGVSVPHRFDCNTPEDRHPAEAIVSFENTPPGDVLNSTGGVFAKRFQRGPPRSLRDSFGPSDRSDWACCASRNCRAAYHLHGARLLRTFPRHHERGSCAAGRVRASADDASWSYHRDRD
jgi:hypothetical protein